jgi:hypothetical protein
MDPPGRRAAQAQPGGTRPSGFPSPTPDYARINPKFNDDCQRMVFAVQQSLPESVRRVIRDNWEKCLLGSEFHQAFIVSQLLFCSALELELGRRNFSRHAQRIMSRSRCGLKESIVTANEVASAMSKTTENKKRYPTYAPSFLFFSFFAVNVSLSFCPLVPGASSVKPTTALTQRRSNDIAKCSRGSAFLTFL